MSRRRRQAAIEPGRGVSPPAGPAARPTVTAAVPLAVLVCVTLLAYLNSFAGDFQFDDYNVIVFNQPVHSLSAWAQGMPGIRPLLKLSYTLNWLAGPGVFGFHLVNLAVHVANTLMVFWLLKPAGGSRPPAARTTQVAFLTALLFALHPVQTEAVTYISGRSVSLMVFFYLASLLAYERGRQTGKWYWFHAVSPGLFVLAMLIRETAATLPLALLLWEAAFPPAPSAPRWRVCLQRQAVHWVLLLLGLMAMLGQPAYRELLAVSLGQRDVLHTLLTQINAVSYLLTRLAWIHRLNIDPDLPLLAAWSPWLALQALSLLALLVLGLTQWRKRSWLTFCVLWFFLHLAPTNSILLRSDVANERHLYLSNLGVFYLLAGAWFAAWSKVGRTRRLAMGTAGVALLLVLGAYTLKRNATYEYQLSLWLNTVQNSPDKARPHNNLGFAYALEGESDQARQHYLTALRLQPDYPLARKNLSALSSRQFPGRRAPD